MTIDRWLMVVLILSTLIAPTLAELIKPRTNQPYPTPELSQPRIGDWLRRVFQSPWYFPPVVVVLNIIFLVLDMRKTAPITRITIYNIAIDVAGIWYGFVLFLLNIAWQSITRHSESNLKLFDLVQSLSRSQSDIDRGIIDITKSLANDLHTTAETIALIQQAQRLQTELTESKKVPSGRLGKLLKGPSKPEKE